MKFGPLGGALQRGALYATLFLLPFSKAAVEIGSVLLIIGWLFERLDPQTRRRTVWLRPSFRPSRRPPPRGWRCAASPSWSAATFRKASKA